MFLKEKFFKTHKIYFSIINLVNIKNVDNIQSVFQKMWEISSRMFIEVHFIDYKIETNNPH